MVLRADIAHFMKCGDEFTSTHALRAAAPHASPNRRIIALADDILGCGGRFIEACAAMGPGEPVMRVPLVDLSLVGQSLEQNGR